MTIEVTQIANSQTFGAWLATTNRIANIISQNTVTTDSTTGGSLTTGNGFVNGYFGANYVYVNTGLVGGNVSTNGEILVLSNTKYQYAAANLVSITANTTVRAVAAVVNTISLTGTVTAANTLAVTGAVALSNTLSVAGNTVLSGTANVTGNLAISASSRFIISNGATIEANGGIGSSGDILLSNGAGVYWAAASTLGVNEAGNYNWTGFHSHASNLHVGNATVNTQISNAAIRLSNSTFFTTLSLESVRVGNTSINTVISSGVSSFSANVHTGNSTINTQISNGNLLVSNSSTTTVVGVGDIRIGNTSSNVVLANTTSRFGGNVVITGTANVSANLVVGASGELIISNGAGIEANGTLGTTGQVLVSNSTGVTWVSPAALDTVNTTAQYTWSNLNTFQSNLHTGGSTVNTQISNSVIRLANSTSTTTVQLADIRVGNTATNVVIANTTSSFGGNVTISGTANVTGITSAAANVHVGNSTVNTQISNAFITVGNSSTFTAIAEHYVRVGNTATNVVISNTVSSFGGNVSILGVANVTGNVTVGSTGFFVGNGTFITTLNASSLSTGLVASARLPTGTVSQAGIVQLIDSTSCTSITLAATANSVKSVYDFAATIAATGTPPSGSNQHIQFNSSGVFGGLAGFTYNSASNTVSIGEGGRLNVGNATVNTSLTTSVLTINGVQIANVGGANNAYFLNGNLPSFYTNATNLNAGTVGTARLATSGTAGSTTFLRGDQAWAAAVTQVSSGSGLTGGPITTTGTLSVLANTTNGLVANDTGVHINSAYIATLTANNTTNFNNQPASFYTNASNLSAGTVGTARLASGTPSGTTFLRGDQTWSTAVTAVTSGSGLTGSVTTTGSLAVLSNTGIVANVTGVFVNAAYIATLDANNASNLNDQPASYYRNASNLNDGTVGTARLATTGTAGSNTFLRGDQAWSTAVTSVTSGSGLTGSVTTTGSLAVLANSGIIANSTGVFVNGNTGIVANATGVFVNASYIATLTANNSTNFNSQPASFYANATNLTTGTLDAARLPAAVNNATNLTTGTVATARLATTGTAGSTTFLRGDQSWSTAVTSVSSGSGLTGSITTTGSLAVLPNTGIVANATGVFVNASYIATLTANNSTNFNSQPASFYANAENLTSGTLNAGRLPAAVNNATNLTTGTLNNARLPSLISVGKVEATDSGGGVTVITTGRSASLGSQSLTFGSTSTSDESIFRSDTSGGTPGAGGINLAAGGTARFRVTSSVAKFLVPIEQSDGTSVPPRPTSSGVGTWVSMISGPTGGYTLPSGGTWAYFLPGVISGSPAGIGSGGTTYSSGGEGSQGFAWRIT